MKKHREREKRSLSVFPIGLVGAGNFARTQTSGADRNGCRSSVDNGFDSADIGLPGSVGLAVGVRDVVSEDDALSANFTFCHYRHLLSVFEYMLFLLFTKTQSEL